MFFLIFILVSFLPTNHKPNIIHVSNKINLSIKSQNTMQIKVNGKVLDIRLENNLNPEGLENVLGKENAMVNFQ